MQEMGLEPCSSHRCTPVFLRFGSLLLSVRVVNLRRRGIVFGDNGEIGVIRVVRAQANFAEYVPLALLLMGFLEVSRYSIYMLHALGLILLVARLIHGAALRLAGKCAPGASSAPH